MRTPGPNFCQGDLHWAGGRLDLSTLVNGRSFLLFAVLGYDHSATTFLEHPVASWPQFAIYRRMHHVVTNLMVVNDPAER